MAEHRALVRNLLLGSIALLVVVVLARAARREEGHACPREFPQTRLAATLLWSQPRHVPLPAAPFFMAFYRVGGVYVVPIVPRMTRSEIEA